MFEKPRIEGQEKGVGQVKEKMMTTSLPKEKKEENKSVEIKMSKKILTLADKLVLTLVFIWLSLFWSGFAIGFWFGRGI